MGLVLWKEAAGEDGLLRWLKPLLGIIILGEFWGKGLFGRRGNERGVGGFDEGLVDVRPERALTWLM